ncbi:MAG TPA: putative DNA modification/repair radical SAM protein [Candidatus Woesearchaeota archaeon]|nr:putative DNA modification/repair radical SAM protein [Candidatus Woesearchaeota archaeon]
MNITQKVSILGEAGKWDVCASSNSLRKVKTQDRIGNPSSCGICHSFTEDGRCISLFKVLMTNSCSFDCKYCQNSISCSGPKAMLEPEELAKAFMSLYIRNYVEGLFLSSGILGEPDKTTEKMIEAVKLLRNKYKFQGYIHFKVLPGTSRELIRQASELADRLSINIEAPSKSRLSELSSVKDYKIDILRRQAWIKNMKVQSGQTTQMVVGASDETDLEVLKMADWEYHNMRLKRAYYSAFTPVPKTPLHFRDKTPLEREHRLYNVDFMMRKYGIKLKEFKAILNEKDNLPKGDPKISLAKQHFSGPIDINQAGYDELIRVPGIGPRSAFRIMSLRKKKLRIARPSQLESIGVVMKRAAPFLMIGCHIQRKVIDFAKA